MHKLPWWRMWNVSKQHQTAMTMADRKSEDFLGKTERNPGLWREFRLETTAQGMKNDKHSKTIIWGNNPPATEGINMWLRGAGWRLLRPGHHWVLRTSFSNQTCAEVRATRTAGAVTWAVCKSFSTVNIKQGSASKKSQQNPCAGWCFCQLDTS